MSLPKLAMTKLGHSLCLALAMVAVAAPVNASTGDAAIRVAQANTSDTVQLAQGHPDRYVVVKGDTLWDISGKFLTNPWLWPEIWYVNPQVENPHLIYPGDVLVLIWVDGRPQLRLERGTTEKLSPRVRSTALDEAITTLSHDAIAGFLSRPGIISEEQRESAPYVLSTRQGHLVAAAGMDLYVRRNKSAAGSDLSIMHVGEPLVDPDNGDRLGYEAHYVGMGNVSSVGDPATVKMTESHREALEGDLLFAEAEDFPNHYIPHAPNSEVNGQVISVAAGSAMAGQFMVIAFNRGSRHGIEPGHVLSVWNKGDVVIDRVKGGMMGEKVQLPDEYAGKLMVFKVGDRMSFGLIISAEREIGKLDFIRNP